MQSNHCYIRLALDQFYDLWLQYTWFVCIDYRQAGLFEVIQVIQIWVKVVFCMEASWVSKRRTHTHRHALYNKNTRIFC